MALWEKIRSRGEVEDRRSHISLVGGMGGTGILLLVVLSLLAGGDPAEILGQLENVQIENSRNLTDSAFDSADDYEVFAATVLGSSNDMWDDLFAQDNKVYDPPKLVLFRNATESGCGVATSQVGPHYCSIDQTIYLDETFFDELEVRFGAQGGDVAEAYVIAHEVAHHVQKELGIWDMANALRDRNEASIKLELQADCFAGLWAYSIRDLGVFERDEIQEVMSVASSVGDDRIQEKVTGQVNPETWTHGSSDQRVEWFTRGYENGSFAQCNTFSR